MKNHAVRITLLIALKVKFRVLKILSRVMDTKKKG
jgi:hypothetical protein